MSALIPRRARALAVGGALLAAMAQLAAQTSAFSFDSSAIGAPPDGFVFAAARQLTPGNWEVRGSGTQRHLIHAADLSVVLRGMSVAAVAAEAPVDVTVAARIRFIDGDRAAGVVWRYQDAGNFYFCGVQLKDRTVALVRVTDGTRVRLDLAENLNLDGDAWHTLDVTQIGDQIQAHLDGIGIVHARDRTFQSAGRAGIWSAGNSTSWFDDVRVSAADSGR